MRLSVLLVLWLGLVPFAVMAQNDPDPNCTAAPLPRLIIGEQGIITPGSANNVRDAASANGNRTGRINGGEVIDVLAGPVCADGFNWWQVEYMGGVGWTVEGSLDEYWIEPYIVVTEAPATPTATKTESPTGTPIRYFEPPTEVVNQLAVGTTVRVINDDPDTDMITLVIRSEPARSGSVVAQAFEGDLLTIIGEAVEADGLRWWQVETANGLQGWTVEGLVNTAHRNTYERTLLPICPADGDRVVFRLDDFVMTSDPDGNEPCILDRINVPEWLTSSDSVFFFNNVFLTTPDGEFFIYADDGLYRLNRDGSERYLLTEESVRWASISPDGEQIAIATGTSIATFNSDGSRYVTQTQGNTIRLWVEWLSDSETLVYTEQSAYLDQLGTAIDYKFYRVNTKQGGLRPIVTLPRGFDLGDVALSTVSDQLAFSGIEYGLIDHVNGNQLLKLDAPIVAYTRIVNADTGDLVQEIPERLLNMRWTPDDASVLGHSIGGDEVMFNVETGTLTPLTPTDDEQP